ncbi:MAG TPA: hypothetical protein DCP08_08210 [Chloroflexi bacterium]|nr:hypothetical protein [Chloroflexota bacterium]
MPKVTLRLFGFGDRADRFREETRAITHGATVRSVWEELRTTTGQEELLARIDEGAVLVLINGRPIHQLEDWQTVLDNGDKVTILVKAFGG